MLLLRKYILLSSPFPSFSLSLSLSSSLLSLSQSKQVMEELRRLKIDGESLLQENDMVHQLGASQEVVSDLRSEVETLRSKLMEEQTSSG